MYNSKPIHIIETLSKVEWRKFDQYLKSKSISDNISFLHQYISKCLPHLTEKNCERQYLYKRIFKDKFNEKKLRYLFSDYTKLLEEFIQFYQLIEDRALSEYFLAKFYSKKRLDKYTDQSFNKLDKIIEVEIGQSGRYFRMKYLKDDLRNEHNYLVLDRSDPAALEESMKSLDLYFVASKLKAACIHKIWNSKFVTSYEPVFIQRILLLIEAGELEENPFIKIYSLIYNLLSSENDAGVHEIMKELELHRAAFPTIEIREIYGYIKNFYALNINKGKTNFARKLLDVYQSQIETKALILNGTISQWDYKNIITLSIKLHDLVFAESFLEDYIKYIPAEFRDNSYHLNKAILQYAKEDFGAAMHSLFLVNQSNPRYYIQSKALLQKIYYDTDEFDPLFSLFDSFDIYLRRNKELKSDIKAVHQRFITITKKMAKIKLGSTIDPKKIMENLEQNKIVMNYSWLVERLQVLINKQS